MVIIQAKVTVYRNFLFIFSYNTMMPVIGYNIFIKKTCVLGRKNNNDKYNSMSDLIF